MEVNYFFWQKTFFFFEKTFFFFSFNETFLGILCPIFKMYFAKVGAIQNNGSYFFDQRPPIFTNMGG